MLVTYNHEYPKQLRTGVIGCGGHAHRNVYPTFQYAPVNLVAVCDLDPVRSATCAKVFGAERHHSDWKSLETARTWWSKTIFA